MVYTFVRETDLDLNDPDTKEFFELQVQWRLKKAFDTAVRVTKKDLNQFKQRKYEQAREQAEKLKREQQQKAKEQAEQRERAEKQKRDAEDMQKAAWAYKKPERTQMSALPGESHEDFLLRVANNANARRQWDRLNKTL